MVTERKLEIFSNLVIDNQMKAIGHLNQYFEKPEEAILREHQIDVMQSLHDFFANGESAGYISLPTGSGKTVLASELTKALSMKTAILSPTQTILRQTGDTIRRLTPEVEVGDFYAAEKDLSGRVLNTTYQSFLKLLENKKINPSEIELLICDEAHLALGEDRHKLFRQLPNALFIGLTATPFFTPLAGYERRGIVSERERWIGLFKKQIHEMSLEESMQRGILAPLDVHLVKTNINVDEVEILSSGEYSRPHLERYLNTEARNYLTVGMLAGVHKIPNNINLSDKQRIETEEIHQKIKDKQTAIFAISIAHAEHLTNELKKIGLKAESIHSKIPFGRRQSILNAHAKGDIQIVLGVDMLRLGWDSPQTEVGIFLAPTYSGIVAVQELGRILRVSGETGKESATAIQFVDDFTIRGQTPVLIPNIFDPYYVLRGTQTGDFKTPGRHIDKKAKKPITFLGFQVETIIEEAFTNQLLKERFRQGSIFEMSSIIDRIIQESLEKHPELSIFEFYKFIEKNIPRISAEKQNEALQAVASIDSNVSKVGSKVLLFTSLGTIFNAIEPYHQNDQSENSDILQEAISEVLLKINKPNRKVVLSQDIYSMAQNGAIRYVASREGMPKIWVQNKKHKMIARSVDMVLNSAHGYLSENEVLQLAFKISNETGISQIQLENYLIARNQIEKTSDSIETQEYFEFTSSNRLKDEITDAIESLTVRERRVIELRFGLIDGKELTLNEIGDHLGVHRERARQIEVAALNNLRKRYWLLHGYKKPIEVISKLEEKPIEELDTQKELPAGKIPIGKRWQINYKESGQLSKWTEWAKKHPLPENATIEDEIIRYWHYKNEYVKLFIN